MVHIHRVVLYVPMCVSRGMMFRRFVHFVACGWVICHCMYTPLFVHAFIHDENWSCFRVLAIVNSAAYPGGSTRTCNCLGSCFQTSGIWGVKSWGHTVGLCLRFWGTARLFSTKKAVPFYVLSGNVQGSHFSTSSSTLVVVCFLIVVIQCEPVPHGGFGLCFPDD